MTDYLTDAQNDIKTYFETHDIPAYFYQCLFGELVKVFGAKFLIPDDDYFYREQLELHLNNLGGTGGWYEAFSATCDQCDLMDIWGDYEKMDWVYSDTFDGYIADKMVEVLFDGTRHDDYYRFKIQKEKKDEE